MLGVLTARRLAPVVVGALNRLVADVAEHFGAFLAGEHVCSPFLPVDLTAVGTLYNSPDVDVGVLTHPHVLLDHLCRYLKWQEC